MKYSSTSEVERVLIVRNRPSLAVVLTGAFQRKIFAAPQILIGIGVNWIGEFAQ